MGKFESPKAKWPRSRPIRGGGTRISGKYLPPLFPGAVPVIYSLIVFALCALMLADTGSLAAVAVWAALMALVYIVLWKRTLTGLLSKFLDIRVFPDRIEVRQGFFLKDYSRSHPIAFRIERVDDRPAVEVVMQYGERRIPLARMPLADLGNAQALLARLREAMAETEARAAKDAAAPLPMQRRYSPYSSAAHLYG